MTNDVPVKDAIGEEDDSSDEEAAEKLLSSPSECLLRLTGVEEVWSAVEDVDGASDEIRLRRLVPLKLPGDSEDA